MRPAVYGGEIVKRDNKIVGFNIGYNFYCEHECGVLELINNLNNQYLSKLSLNDNQKLYKNGFSLTYKYKKTPFSKCILRGNIDYIRKEIIIDNDILIESKKYSCFLLSNGNYTMFKVSSEMCLQAFREKYGQKRKFTEEELLDMSDYNIDMSFNMGFQLSGGHSIINSCIIGSWGSDGFTIFIPKMYSDYIKNLADDFENSLKTGSLAICNGNTGLFKDRGLSFVMLDKCYPELSNITTKKFGLFNMRV